METQIIIDALKNELGLFPIFLEEKEQELIEIIEDKNTTNIYKANEIAGLFEVRNMSVFFKIKNILDEN